jgi:hypothetical protein
MGEMILPSSRMGAGSSERAVVSKISTGSACFAVSGLRVLMDVYDEKSATAVVGIKGRTACYRRRQTTS